MDIPDSIQDIPWGLNQCNPATHPSYVFLDGPLPVSDSGPNVSGDPYDSEDIYWSVLSLQNPANTNQSTVHNVVAAYSPDVVSTFGQSQPRFLQDWSDMGPQIHPFPNQEGRPYSNGPYTILTNYWNMPWPCRTKPAACPARADCGMAKQVRPLSEEYVLWQ